MVRTRTRFRRHQRHWLPSILVVLVMSGVGWWSWEQYSGQQQSRAAEGARAPAFTLPSSTGSPVALGSYLGRQPVVLIFYMGEF